MENLAFMQTDTTASSSSGQRKRISSSSTRQAAQASPIATGVSIAAVPEPALTSSDAAAPAHATGGKKRARQSDQRAATKDKSPRSASAKSTSAGSSRRSTRSTLPTGSHTGAESSALEKPRSKARQSTASESSYAASSGVPSPLSAPATPATSYSASTTSASASSSSAGITSKRQRVAPREDAARAQQDTDADAATGSGSASQPLDLREAARLQRPDSVRTEASPSSSRTNKRTLCLATSSEEGQSKKSKHSEANKEVANKRGYSLRSRTNMAPKKQQPSSGNSGAAARTKQSRRSKGQRDSSSTSHTTAATSACLDRGEVPLGLDNFDRNSFSEDEEVHGHEEEGVPERKGGDDDDDDGEEAAGEEGGDNVEAAEGDAMLGRDADELDEDDDDDDESYDRDLDDPYGDEGGGDDDGGGFGSRLRAMAGYMSGLSGRFRTLLSSLREYKDPTTQMIALQELSEVLSISNEDTLAGYFPTESFVAELIFLMGGPKPKPPKVLGESSASKEEETDEDEAIAILTGLGDNTEMMLLACRCLANLIEAMPYAAHSIVSHGAVPVLNSKLLEIEFIDLAEQVLQTLEKISREFPSAIVNNGGLSAMLQYLDFFNIHVQRTALNAAANCCRKLSSDAFEKVKDVIPIIQNVLSYSDQRLVESACRCIVRIIDSYRHHTELLEQLLTNEVVAAVNRILLPNVASGNGSSTSTANISPAVYAEVLKALVAAAHSSPILAVTLLENNIVETLYHLLTGSPAPAQDGSGGDGPATKNGPEEKQAAIENNAGAAMAVVNNDGSESIGMADVAVLQNLAQRPREQVQEALALISELLPPIPRSGVFDPRRYTERALNKRRAKLAKEERNSEKTTAQGEESMSSPARIDESTDKAAESRSAAVTPSKPERVKTERELAKERAQLKRTETLQQRQGLVRRFTQLVLPTLVEVYAASVAWHVRSRALYGILKLVTFVEPSTLKDTLDTVPLASFIAGILSGRDHPMLVQGALQLVELLTIKLPDVYGALLRREGVMWEIDDIASREVKDTAACKSDAKKVQENASTSKASWTDASRALTTDAAETKSGQSGTASIAASLNQAAKSIDSAKTLLSDNSMSLADAEDSMVWRARVLREKFLPDSSDSSAGGAGEASRALSEIKQKVEILENEESLDRQKACTTLEKIAELFSKPENPVSSFELLRSGLVSGLYNFAVGTSEHMPNAERRKIVMDTLMQHQASGAKSSAAEALVRRLQETLSRLENVEITTALSGLDDSSSRRSAAANVTRQVRLKLVAEGASDGEIPRSCTNIVVSIHAITSFQSLHDYLRPKISASQTLGSSGSASSSSMSNILAAFASSAGALQMGSDFPEALRQKWNSAGQQPGSSGTGKTKSSAVEPSDEAAASASATGEARNETKTQKSTRRRSSRLSAKDGSSTKERDDNAAEGKSADNQQTGRSVESADQEQARQNATAVETDGDNGDALTRKLVEGILQGRMGDLVDDDEAYSDDYDEEFIDDEDLAAMESGHSTGDQTIQLKVDKDGDKVTTDSPVPGENGAASSSSAASRPASTKAPATPASGGISYASALQKKPVDWHLAFEMDGNPLSLESTIYSAIHNHEMRMHPPVNGQPHPSSRFVWSNTYTIKYRKVAGSAPAPEKNDKAPLLDTARGRHVDLPACLAGKENWAPILQLLRVLYDLNNEWRETSQWAAFPSTGALSESAFVNNKITAKLNRQLEEPMIVASNCMPAWSLELPKTFPFLFPFETRFNFLQSTSFGYNRLINRWQMQQSRSQDGGGATSRHDDSLAFLGRLTRQKVRISRNNILASAFKVFELYGGNSSMLEVEYFDEVGTGLGPTLEFYAMVSKEFAKRSLNLWRTDEGREDGEFVYAPSGLFPLPMPQNIEDNGSGKARLRAFKTLGQFVAKALYDSRIVDLNFSTPFMRAILQEQLPATLPLLRSVDNALAQSLEKLKAMPANELESLSLDFTLPGQADYELHANGSKESVTSDNVDRYIDEVIEHTLVTGIAAQVAAFREGFDLIFPTSAMSTFTPEEMALLFGNQDEDWSEPTLLSTIKPDHGYNIDSVTFRDVIALMSQFSLTERRDFLQWLTGSPKLPIGGFMGLHPQLTIVKRPPDSNVSADQTLPSVMTCVNFCKMPPFSSRAVMKERLLLAMHEGQASFHLS